MIQVFRTPRFYFNWNRLYILYILYFYLHFNLSLINSIISMAYLGARETKKN